MEKYSVNAWCDNCEQSVTIELRKGTPVSPNMECPNCGCKTANKRTPQKVDTEITWPKYPPPQPYWLSVPEEAPKVYPPPSIKCSDEPPPPYPIHNKLGTR